MNNYPFKNSEKYLLIENFIREVTSRKGIQIPTHRMKPTASELFAQSKYSAGGLSNILTGNVTREVGVTNFDGNKLENDRCFVIEGVTLMYGEGESSKKVYEIAYDTKLPAILKSSNLLIRQNNMVLVNLPIQAIENAKQLESFYRDLDSLVFLEPNQPIEILIESPVGSTITPSSGDTSFVKVMLKGFETQIR
ncbi:hypothetical protein RCZ02_16650 [Capnocytophaga felis]|uniref:Uncharacterized protein n=1 Tax=Capnocytophaga cynodegmi TaxID=28189 RepID=A0A250E6C5_9FLAO|nr:MULTISPECIES: hypothetical protein [Capnocytophaga]ATA67276.1 hypothetical protein CGC48_00765 [Capnocytophaga cynodegmi]GET48834.1 hypothetical protein RCZ02_16650 [Capnocytophaga felis]